MSHGVTFVRAVITRTHRKLWQQAEPTSSDCQSIIVAVTFDTKQTDFVLLLR